MNTVDKDSKSRFASFFTTVPGSILVGSLLISFSILLNGGIIKIKGITPQNLTAGNQQVAQAPTQPKAQQIAPPEDTGPVKVSLDDDPVLGNKNAPVTLVDFTDYECPFCKRHFDQTYAQIKTEYIDTGKVKLVTRDLPLAFHANAPKEAQAAECARQQGGDSAYYKYHDEIFKRTTSNGTGLALTELSVIATDLGLNGTALQTCLDTDKFKAEVEKDLADANKYGASGTPTFFIGKSTGQEIVGTKIAGAQPFSAFKTIIDELLK